MCVVFFLFSDCPALLQTLLYQFQPPHKQKFCFLTSFFYHYKRRSLYLILCGAKYRVCYRYTKYFTTYSLNTYRYILQSWRQLLLCWLWPLRLSLKEFRKDGILVLQVIQALLAILAARLILLLGLPILQLLSVRYVKVYYVNVLCCLCLCLCLDENAWMIMNLVWYHSRYGMKSSIRCILRVSIIWSKAWWTYMRRTSYMKSDENHLNMKNSYHTIHIISRLQGKI